MSKKELHIFDLDNTLFETPEFAEFVKVDSNNIVIKGNHDEYFMNVKAAFLDLLSKYVYFKRTGDFIVPINQQTDKPFDEDILDYFKKKISTSKMLIPHNGIAVLNAFPGFHKSPDTLGLVINEPIFQDYENADNKMIITGRNEELREKINSIFKYLGIKQPNYGLYLYSQNGKTNIENFKIQTIIQSIKEHGWDIVHFYEDRKDWLMAAQRAVAQVFPGVEFVSHLVTNVKDKRSL